MICKNCVEEIEFMLEELFCRGSLRRSEQVSILAYINEIQLNGSVENVKLLRKRNYY